MKYSVHSNFIKTPLLSILEEAVQSLKMVGDKIETQPMKEYFFQSLFLKMTGASEQKCKCICWDLATYDFEFRQEFLRNKSNDVFSTIDSKNFVYEKIIEHLSKEKPTFSIDERMREGILDETKTKFYSLLNDSNLAKINLRNYEDAKSLIEEFTVKSFATNTRQIFQKGDVAYKYLYEHRNRCAHNLTSYQEDFPSLNRLKKEDIKYHNYFYFFFLLFLIDIVYIYLYKKYLGEN